MRLKFDPETNLLEIPDVTGVTYLIDDEPVSGTIIIEKDTMVTAEPKKGYSFKEGADTSWLFKYTPEEDESDSEDLVEIIETSPEDDE